MNSSSRDVIPSRMKVFLEIESYDIEKIKDDDSGAVKPPTQRLIPGLHVLKLGTLSLVITSLPMHGYMKEIKQHARFMYII